MIYCVMLVELMFGGVVLMRYEIYCYLWFRNRIVECIVLLVRWLSVRSWYFVESWYFVVLRDLVFLIFWGFSISLCFCLRNCIMMRYVMDLMICFLMVLEKCYRNMVCVVIICIFLFRYVLIFSINIEVVWVIESF